MRSNLHFFYRGCGLSMLAALLSSPIHSPNNGSNGPSFFVSATPGYGEFDPLPSSCTSCGTTTSLSTLTIPTGSPIIIPCGTCVVNDMPDGTELTVDGGLVIQGKLNLGSSGEQITISTPYVVVEGELEATNGNNDAISPSNLGPKIILTDNLAADVSHAPATQQTGAACTSFSDGKCPLGKKPFVVMGGKLNIDMAPANFVSWKTAKDLVEGSKATKAEALASGGIIAQKAVLPAGCPEEIFNDGFDTDMGGWVRESSSQTLALTGSSSLHVNGRNRTWKGMKRDFTAAERACLVPNAPYYFSVRAKLVDPSGANPAGTMTPCRASGSRCFRVSKRFFRADGTNKQTSIKYQDDIFGGTYDEYVTITGVFSFTDDDLNSTHTSLRLEFDDSPVNMDIYVDSFEMRTATASQVSDETDPCDELFVNGNGDAHAISEAPWVGRNDAGIALASDSSLPAPSFYFQMQRAVASRTYSSIRQDLSAGCFKHEAAYELSFQWRHHNPDTSAEMNLQPRIQSYQPDGSYVQHYFNPSKCGLITSADGWTTCTLTMAVDQKLATATSAFFYFNHDDTTTDHDVAQLSLKYVSGPGLGVKVEASGVVGSWGAGSSALLTSYTMSHSHSDIERTISSVTDNGDGTASILFDEPIPMRTPTESTMVDGILEGDFPIEVALLTRNFVIQAESDAADANKGGHFNIAHTPGQSQLVSGVEMVNMGRKGVANQYGLMIEMSGNQTGTIISSNTIRNGNHRGINIKGTNDVLITNNVLYDIGGHGFECQDGAESRNKFHYNLGAHIRRIADSIDDEDDPAVFYSRALGNEWLGNVAAGGDHGFKFDLSKNKVVGESLDVYGTWSTRNVPLSLFKDNVAHSSWDYGLYARNMNKGSERDTFENFKAYKNQDGGAYFYECDEITLDGGLFADNKRSIDLNECDDVEIKNMVIHGITDGYENIRKFDRNAYSLCASTTSTICGVRTSSYLDSESMLYGLMLDSVDFEGFGKNVDGCSGGSKSVTLRDYIESGHWDYRTTFRDVTFSDSNSAFVDACPAAGMADMIITDVGPSSSYDGIIYQSPTSIVSNFDYMTTFPGSCVSFPGECTAICENTCLRNVNFLVRAAGTSSWSLKVKRTSDNAEISIPGTFWANARDESNVNYDRKFTASLPAGSYEARFFDEAGNHAWPSYVTEVWDIAPDCSGHANIGDITVIEPTVDCETMDLILDGNMDNDLGAWQHDWGGLTYLPNGGEGNSGAIETVVDDTSRIGQALPTICLGGRPLGSLYEISAKFRLEDASGNPVTCNAAAGSIYDSDSCPSFFFEYQDYQDPTEKLQGLGSSTHIYSGATTVIPTNSDPSKFSLISGIFSINENLSSANKVYLYASNRDDSRKMILDSVTVVPLDNDCTDLVRNGNLTDGSLYWKPFSGPSLSIVDGYNPTDSPNNAIKASERDSHYDSPAQELKVGCMTEGQRYIIRAAYKITTPGTNAIFLCDPYIYSRDNSPFNACPQAKLKAIASGLSDEYKTIGYASPQDPATGWGTIAGAFTATSQQEAALKIEAYFDNLNLMHDLTIDSLQIVSQGNRTCDSLILNGNADEGLDFWRVDSNHQSSLELTPEGSIRSFMRSHYYRGASQQVDEVCIVEGETFEVSMKVKLLDSNGNGAGCVPGEMDVGDEDSCPFVYIFGDDCVGNDIYIRLWNDVPYLNWDPDNFNDFKVEFTVDSDLAACKKVYAQIEGAKAELDIVFDDFAIVSTERDVGFTIAPTKTPSGNSGRIATTAPTFGPTTPHPTHGTLTVCPEAGTNPIELSGGSYTIGLASPETLCTLTKVTTDGSSNVIDIVPIARSYGGYEWEKSAGDFAQNSLGDMVCFATSCKISLPSLGSSESYALTTYTREHNCDVDNARFLESATFGTTSNDLNAMRYMSKEGWIKSQISTELTSHREFFRERANPRWAFPQVPGVSDHPCKSFSRWRKYAVSITDSSTAADNDYPTRYVTFKPANFGSTSAPFVLYVDERPRTILDSIMFSDGSQIELDTEYEICNKPDGYVGSQLKLEKPGSSCKTTEFGNPLVNFTLKDNIPTYVVQLGAVELIDEYATVNGGGDDFILQEDLVDAVCNAIPQIRNVGDVPVFGKLPDGTWLIHDPRLTLEKNTEPSVPDSIGDGGGSLELLTGGATRCSNAPRTIFNKDTCVLSQDASACGPLVETGASFVLDDDNIMTLHTTTDRYVYTMLGLPIIDIDGNMIAHPCSNTGWSSRWEVLADTTCDPGSIPGAATVVTMSELLELSTDTNPFIRDVVFPDGKSCANDASSEMQIQVGTTCFKHVHPDYKSVYDLTYWVSHHPGGDYNIMKWADDWGHSHLIFPSYPNRTGVPNHQEWKWTVNKVKFEYVGRYGDEIKFRDLPNELRTEEVANIFDAYGSLEGTGVVVCGSEGEIPNNPEVGHIFDLHGPDESTFPEYGATEQKEAIWIMIALKANDQLRQRIAWCLSQILVIVRHSLGTSIQRETESYAVYYDILVRNAFGNYRDILRETSFNPFMAEHLSFLDSKSQAYIWEKDRRVSFADENFAREIMQLFTVGLVKLNSDGSPANPSVLAYTNDHIVSYARAWTGFTRQSKRGNVEQGDNLRNRLDPLRIEADWRDKFPKIDLVGGYIGDRFPLCRDLPKQAFLKAGATYRLLGASKLPELMEEEPEFQTDDTIVRMVLPSNSQLRSALSASDTYPGEVTLEGSLECTSGTVECDVDTVRVVQVSTNIFYEYVPPVCVENPFFNNAMTINRKEKDWSGTMCADPFLPVASEACCDLFSKTAIRNPTYDGERMTFATSEERCTEAGRLVCDYHKIEADTHKTGYHWAVDGCKIRARVDKSGNVAIVHEPEQYRLKALHVDDENFNFFPAYWKDDIWPTTENSCLPCEMSTFGGCICDTEVVLSPVFANVPPKATALAELHIGAIDPSLSTETYTSTQENGMIVHRVGANVDINTIFEVTDDFGRTFLLKNAKSDVLVGNSMSFRNPPSFISLIPTESSVGRALHETEAVLDSYFYHENVAPFLALRFIQRFGHANPSPRYIESVGTAFKTGYYESEGTQFGAGVYGDLEATFSAILLDREARTPMLDMDPAFGSIREPLIKVISLLRALEFEQEEEVPRLLLRNMADDIGQMAHDFPSVFSFFLPEYVPPGRLNSNNMLSPEAMILDTPKLIRLMNGVFSMMKYGLSNCNGGFGQSVKSGSCSFDGDYSRANAVSTFSPATPSSEAVVNEMAMLLTAGRLSQDNREVVMNAYDSMLPDATKALILAQQLIASTPEFHTTNTIKSSGVARQPVLTQTSSATGYKATIYLQLSGGCDSYNMLAPHTCTLGPNDLYQQYLEVRSSVALSQAEMLQIDATSSNQACEVFGLHPRLTALRDLYNNGDAIFTANIGVMTKPTDKENYNDDTQTQLFAHNACQREGQRVDPFNDIAGTGVLGRINDVLKNNGLAVSGVSIDSNSVSVVGREPTSMIVNKDGVEQFNRKASTATMNDIIFELNGGTEPDSGFQAETWATSLTNALAQNEWLYEELQSMTTTVVFPDTSIGKKLAMVTKLMRIDQGTNHDAFYVSMGGYDTHSQVEANLDVLFTELNEAIDAFQNELKAHNLWDNTVLVESSDFARTLSPNSGEGTDHAWGGNTFMIGGSVKGGVIKGTFPDDLSSEGSLMLKRGRVVATTPYDAIWHGVAQWLGISSPADMAEILPNSGNFDVASGTLFEQSELFESSRRTLRGHY